MRQELFAVFRKGEEKLHRHSPLPPGSGQSKFLNYLFCLQFPAMIPIPPLPLSLVPYFPAMALAIFSISLVVPQRRLLRYRKHYDPLLLGLSADMDASTVFKPGSPDADGAASTDGSVTLVSVDESIPSMLAGSVGFFGSVDDFSATLSPTNIPVTSPDARSVAASQTLPTIHGSPVGGESTSQTVAASLASASQAVVASLASSGSGGVTLLVKAVPATGSRVPANEGIIVDLHDSKASTEHLIYIFNDGKSLGWSSITKKRWSSKSVISGEGGGSIPLSTVVTVEKGINNASFVGSPSASNCFSIVTERGTLDVEVKDGKRDALVAAFKTALSSGLRMV